MLKRGQWSDSFLNLTTSAGSYFEHSNCVRRDYGRGARRTSQKLSRSD